MIDSTIGDLTTQPPEEYFAHMSRAIKECLPYPQKLPDASIYWSGRHLATETRTTPDSAIINRDAEPPRFVDAIGTSTPTISGSATYWIGGPRATETPGDAITFHPLPDCPITYWDALDGQSEEDLGEFAEEVRIAERARLAHLLTTFRDDNASSRRDTELRRLARNALLDELSAWIAGGALEYTPKD